MQNIVIRAAFIACFAFCAVADFNPSKPPAKPVKSDIKYIKCQVCELLAKNAYRQVNDMKKALRPNKKVCLFAVYQETCQPDSRSKLWPSCAARGDGSD